VIGFRFATLLFLGALFSFPRRSLRDYEKKVTEFTLANGLHFILVEASPGPVVSFPYLRDGPGSAQTRRARPA